MGVSDEFYIKYEKYGITAKSLFRHILGNVDISNDYPIIITNMKERSRIDSQIASYATELYARRMLGWPMEDKPTSPMDLLDVPPIDFFAELSKSDPLHVVGGGEIGGGNK